MMNGYGMMAMMWLFSLLVFGLLLGLGVLVVVLLVRRGGQTGGSSASPPQAESPLDILKRRYAQGEINAEQFERMKRRLGEP